MQTSLRVALQVRLTSAVRSMGIPTRGPHWLYTWMLLPKATTTEQSFTPWADYTQVGRINSTRLLGALGSTVHLRRVYAKLIMRAQERLIMVCSNTNAVCKLLPRQQRHEQRQERYDTAELQTYIDHPRAYNHFTKSLTATHLPRQAGWQLLFELLAH